MEAAKTKFETVYRDLRTRVSSMPAGARVPSVRDVMKEFGISQVTAHRAIHMLGQDGVIVRHVGKGSYVSHADDRSRAQQKCRIVFALQDFMHMPADAIASEFVSAVERHGYETGVIRFNWRDGILRTLPRERIDALVMYPAATVLSVADISRIGAFGIPVVLIDRVVRGVGIDCVGSDNELGGAMAATHLVKLGHRRLAVLISEPHTVAVNDRVAGFVKQVKLLTDAEVRIFDCQTVSGQVAADRAYDRIREEAARGPLDFTGMFVVSDGSAIGAIKALHDVGVALPGQMSLVGFDDIPMARCYHPSLTTIRQHYDKMAAAAVDILERRLGGDEMPRTQQMIAPSLVVRESTVAV